jgi:arylsulfatase A-like enzyme
MKELLLPGLDLALPALLRDLDERGMLEETLVIWMSEHGRTPTLVPNRPDGGRDHWSRAYSALVAGGGTARGKVVGRTTRDGGDVLETPVSPKDILATTFHLLGIDPATTVADRQGRPHRIAGDGIVRPEVLG